MPFPQCSCTFHCKIYTRLLFHSSCCTSRDLTTHAASSFLTFLNFFYYVFCGLAICAALSSTLPFLTFSHKGHSLYLCSLFPHLKHSTATTSCLFIILFFTPHCITLLNNTSNLFWGVVVPFSCSCSYGLGVQTFYN